MRNQKINKRNLALLSAAIKDFTLQEVNDYLNERLLKPVNHLDWELWVNFYLPIVDKDIIYEQELLYNNRSLSWFANDLKKRYEKLTIS